MALVMFPIDHVEPVHVLQFQSALAELAELGEEGIPYELYLITAERRAAHLQAQADAAMRLPWAEQPAAVLDVLRTAVDNVWYFAQQPQVMQTIYRKFGEFWCHRNRLDDAGVAQLGELFGRLVTDSAGPGCDVAASRMYALSLVWGGEDQNVDYTMLHFGQHARAMANTHRMIAAFADVRSDAWGLTPLAPYERYITHEIVVIDGSPEDRWSSGEDDDDEGPVFYSCEDDENTFDDPDPVVVIDYCGLDLAEHADYDDYAEHRYDEYGPDDY